MDINSIWSELLVEELVRHGAGTFFLAPGSRCAPLTLAIARNARAEVVQHVDERGLAFAALGYARGSGRPGVIVTTSGTAVANLLPAVVEASLEDVPMVVLSADRPPELRDTSANQSIDQVKIFGSYVRSFVDLPCPTTDIDPAYVLTTVADLVRRAGRGPVHVNCMFREPLAPDPTDAVANEYTGGLAAWRESSAPYTSIIPGAPALTTVQVRELAELVERHERGVIIAGSRVGAHDAEAVLELAAAADWPVLADVTSGLRCGPHAKRVAGSPDLFFCSDDFIDRASLDCVFHVGGRVVSKRVLQAVEKRTPTAYVVISSADARYDPAHRVTHRVSGVDPGQACRQILEQLSAPRAGAWAERWQSVARAGQEAIAAELGDQDGITEPGIARELAACMNPGHALFLGNSMPVRDMDLYGGAQAADVTVMSNRGASGIDGNIASAVGLAVGRASPVTLLLGDLAALHDLGSLKLMTAPGVQVIAVVVNNNGSAVFSFLPIADEKEVFEQYFGTPHGLNFEPAARMYGLDYFCPPDMMQFSSAYAECVASGRSAVIELVTDRTANTALHARLVERLRGCIDGIDLDG